MNEIVCILLKTREMVLCEVADWDRIDESREVLLCDKPLLMNWTQDKGGNFVAGLSSFPYFITSVVRSAGEHPLPLPRTEILSIYRESELKDEVKMAYKERSIKVYGNIAIIQHLPGDLRGRCC